MHITKVLYKLVHCLLCEAARDRPSGHSQRTVPRQHTACLQCASCSVRLTSLTTAYSMFATCKLFCPADMAHSCYSVSCLQGQRLLVVSFASAPGLPNWGGLLKKVLHGMAEPAHKCFDTLYVVDPCRSWYHGERNLNLTLFVMAHLTGSTGTSRSARCLDALQGISWLKKHGCIQVWWWSLCTCNSFFNESNLSKFLP